MASLRHLVYVGLIAALFTSGLPPALAATPAVKIEQAKEQYRLAREARDKEQWNVAVVYWRKAYELDPYAVYLWGLARDEHRAGMYDRAKAHYEAFLALEEVPPALVGQNARLRTSARKHIAEIRAIQEAAAREAQATEAARLEAERREAQAEAAREAEVDARREAAAQAAREAAAAERSDRERKAQAAASVAAATTVTKTHQLEGDDDMAGWVLVGTGAALILGGVGATAWGLSATDEMDKYSQPGLGQTDDYRARYDAAKSDQDSAEVLYLVGYGAGLAALVTGAVLLASGDNTTNDEVRVGSWLTPAGGGVSVGLGW